MHDELTLHAMYREGVTRNAAVPEFVAFADA